MGQIKKNEKMLVFWKGEEKRYNKKQKQKSIYICRLSESQNTTCILWQLKLIMWKYIAASPHPTPSNFDAIIIF